MSPHSSLRHAAWLPLVLATTLGHVAMCQTSTGIAPGTVDPATGLVAPSALPGTIDPNTGQLIPPAPQAGADLNPSPSWTALLATAKAAEEGDADLAAASDQYVAIIQTFEQLRPIAAEALYRYALVEGRREHGDEAQAAHTRLIQWFPDFPEYVKKSLEARGGTSQKSRVSTPDASQAPAPTPNPPMSPELLARYGLDAATVGAESPGPRTAFKMNPVLMSRYGLMAPAAPAEKPAARSLPRDAKLAELQDRRSELVTEAARTASESRRARIELTRIHGLEPADIPPNLVNDPRLRSLLEELHQRPAGLSDELADRALLRRRNELEEYVEGVYKPRLGRTADILSRELEIMRMDIQQIDMDISKLQPKF